MAIVQILNTVIPAFAGMTAVFNIYYLSDLCALCGRY
jgi:hypothetical protein